MSHLFSAVEICAGAGGMALGLEHAGFAHSVLVENDLAACETLLLNRPDWNVLSMDVRSFDATPYRGIDLLAGGVPCPPFSVAGKQLGDQDERDLFPEVLRIARECEPRAILIENVRGLLDAKFDNYRDHLSRELSRLNYMAD